MTCDLNLEFIKLDLTNKKKLKKVFKQKIYIVFHFAAQAGVRYSLKNPFAYVQSNLVAFVNILEESKNNNISNFLYASTSSVYGSNEYCHLKKIMVLIIQFNYMLLQKDLMN